MFGDNYYRLINFVWTSS